VGLISALRSCDDSELTKPSVVQRQI